jgi:hypothetical protein
MRHDIPSGFRSIALDKQTGVDTKLNKDHGGQREEVSKSRDFCSGLLCRLYRTTCCFGSCAHSLYLPAIASSVLAR